MIEGNFKSKECRIYKTLVVFTKESYITMKKHNGSIVVKTTFNPLDLHLKQCRGFLEKALEKKFCCDPYIEGVVVKDIIPMGIQCTR